MCLAPLAKGSTAAIREEWHVSAELDDEVNHGVSWERAFQAYKQQVQRPEGKMERTECRHE